MKADHFDSDRDALIFDHVRGEVRRENLQGRGVARHDPETSTPGFEQPHNERIDPRPPTGKGAVENRESAPPLQDPDEWMDPDHVMVVLTKNEQRVIWNAVTSLRRRTTVTEIADTCSAIRAKLGGEK